MKRRDFLAAVPVVLANAKGVSAQLSSPLYKTGLYDARDPAFGIVGDGDGAGQGTDDTAAIEAALQGLEPGEVLVFGRDRETGRHHFNVTSVVLDNPQLIYATVRFAHGTRLFGVATEPARAILELRGIRNCVFENLSLASDGSAVTPRFQGQYACALRLSNQYAGEGGYKRDRSCQWNRFAGGQIRNIRRGIVIGNPEDEQASARAPISENVFSGMSFRGVNGPVTMNAENGFAEFAQCVIVAQRFEASDSWWRDEEGFLLKSLAGAILVTGGELQRAIAAGHGLYGQQIHIHGAICEWAAPSHVSGQVALLQPANGYFGPQRHSMFRIAPGVRGRLTLTGQWEKNIPGPGGTAGLLVDASAAPEFDYTLDVDLVDFAWDYNDHLIVGGRPDIRRLAIRDNVAQDVVEYTARPGMDQWDDQIATADGFGMSERLGPEDKAGWTIAVGEPSHVAFGALPSGQPADPFSALRFRSVDLAWIGTPSGRAAIRLRGGGHILSFLIRVTGPTTGFSIRVAFFDRSGAKLAGAQTRFAINEALILGQNLEQWQQMAVPLNAPKGTGFIQIFLAGPKAPGTCDVAVARLRIL